MGQFLPLDDLQTYKQTLQHIPHLKDFRGKYLDELFRASELCDFAAGETIVEEGEFGHRIFFLLLGEVAVTKKGVPVASIRGYGEIFGEDPILNQERRAATVKAVTPCYCLSVHTQRLEMLNDQEQRACFAVIHHICAQVLSRRLKETTEELARVENELQVLRSQMVK